VNAPSAKAANETDAASHQPLRLRCIMVFPPIVEGAYPTPASNLAKALWTAKAPPTAGCAASIHTPLGSRMLR
jgi:hypothetical protein